MTEVEESRGRRPSPLVADYLALTLVLGMLSGVRALHVNTAWALGDWLINYEGGFVRRGLWGTMLLAVSRGLHLSSALLLAVVFGLILYTVLFAAVLRLATSIRWSWWTVCLFVSPVTLSFFFLSVEYFKKEVIVFTGLALLLALLLARQRGRRVPAWLLSGFLIVFGVAATLGYEPSVAYLPYVVPALYLAGFGWREITRIALPAAVCTIVALAAVVTHPGSKQTVEMICGSLAADAPRVCHGGAVEYLAHTRADARAESIETATLYHYATIYPLVTSLALVPYVGGLRALWRRSRDATVVLLGAMVSSAALAAGLFVFASDWGRWIQIGLFCVFLLLFFAEHQPSLRSGEPGAWRAKPWAFALVVLYATCWSMPGYTDRPLFGYLSLASRWLGR